MGRREMKEEEEKKEKLATESRQKKWWETPKRRASSRCSFCSAYSRFSTNDRTTTGRLVGVDYLNTWIINGEEEEEAKDELSATRENCCCCCQLAAVALLLVLRRRKGCVDSFLLVVGATDPYGGRLCFLAVRMAMNGCWAVCCVPAGDVRLFADRRVVEVVIDTTRLDARGAINNKTPGREAGERSTPFDIKRRM